MFRSSEFRRVLCRCTVDEYVSEFRVQKGLGFKVRGPVQPVLGFRFIVLERKCSGAKLYPLYFRFGV